MQLDVFNKRISIEDKPVTNVKPIVLQAQDLLAKYKRDMEHLRNRWRENEEWFKSRHWEYMRNEKFKGDPEPTTAFVLSTIANKHADHMDYYPKANIRPRNKNNVKEAKTLTDILPIELEWNDFQDTWSKIGYDKYKLGSGIYAVLFDPDAQQGIGGNTIKSVDPLNFYCDIRVKSLHESKGIFVVSGMSEDDFKAQYPDKDEKRARGIYKLERYNTETKNSEDDDIAIIDYYYLKDSAEGKVVHLLQFAGDIDLYWSEESKDYADGYYKVDQYPFEIDTLYPEKDNIFGFGLIDVIKSPQVYVDKLDQIILSNTFAHSRKRFFAKDNANINTEDFLDPSVTLVRASNISEDSIREIITTPTDANVYNHRTSKIGELKEVSSANEFARGETNSGVTAAQAIVALQKASNKTSRIDIKQSYSTFSKVIYIYVELIRQFYDIPRSYPLEDNKAEDGYSFVEFDNKSLQPQEQQGVVGSFYRKPIFDFKIVPERQDPFSQAAQNELAKELFGAGAFNPERFLETKALLSMMEFDGKDEIMLMLERNAQIQEQLMMGQQAMIENQKLKLIVQAQNKVDLGVPMPQKGA